MTTQDGMRTHPLSVALIACICIVALSSASGATPRAEVWVTYAPGGATSTNVPRGDGSAIVTVGDLRPPIFSLRLRSRTNGLPEAGLLTPKGFDSYHIRASDIEDEDESRHPYWKAVRRQMNLEKALIHHRPAVHLRVDRQGKSHIRNTSEIRRHEDCARRLLRAAIEEQMAAARDEDDRQEAREELEEDFTARVSPPVEHASLLLRLVMLSLPSSAYDQNLDRLAGGPNDRPSQWDWRLREIRTHGRPVRLQLDLRSAPSSPAASLCRSLAYRTISDPRSDTCTIQGVIDRRDGWPITIGISRKGTAADGATESDFRSFDRVVPLQGFVPPPNPCPAR